MGLLLFFEKPVAQRQSLRDAVAVEEVVTVSSEVRGCNRQELGGGVRTSALGSGRCSSPSVVQRPLCQYHRDWLSVHCCSGGLLCESALSAIVF